MLGCMKPVKKRGLHVDDSASLISSLYIYICFCISHQEQVASATRGCKQQDSVKLLYVSAAQAYIMSNGARYSRYVLMRIPGEPCWGAWTPRRTK